MDMLVWNARGYNNPLKQSRALRKVNRFSGPFFMHFETRIRYINVPLLLERKFELNLAF